MNKKCKEYGEDRNVSNFSGLPHLQELYILEAPSKQSMNKYINYFIKRFS